jgi:hypothetical protein
VKYMIMMFGDQASMESMVSREWIVEMIQFMQNLDAELVASGELVVSEGLADATQAKTVRYEDGETVVTDGPFSESRESLAGFWIVDVENEARALEITRKVVAFTHGPIEVRQVPDGPPAEYV